MKIFHFDFNTAFYTKQYLKEFIQKLHSFGYTALIWELEDFVKFDTISSCWQSDSISKEEFAELLNFSNSLGFENIPLLQTLGHCEYVLSKEEYAKYADNKGTLTPYCPSKKEVKDFLTSLINEYLELFSNSKYFHLGCDEVWNLGENCPICKEKISLGQKGKLMAGHIDYLANILLKNHKIPMIWADMLLIHPEMTNFLSKEIILVDWRYELREDSNKLWLWNDKGGYLISPEEIDDTMKEIFGLYLYKNNKVNIHYTTDFLTSRGYKVICAGASSCYPDNFLLGNASQHIANACTMLKKGLENQGYLHTSWSVHLFPYELQSAIELASNTNNYLSLQENYTIKYFGIKSKDFFEAIDMLTPRVLFSGAESTGCGKAIKTPPPDVIKKKLVELDNLGILKQELDKTTSCKENFERALSTLQNLRKDIQKGYDLFDRYILSAKALVNRCDFGIYAASKYLHLPCSIDANKLKAELIILREEYFNDYQKKLTLSHANRFTQIIFDTLLEYLNDN